jgi:hypothetical protein
MSPPRMPMAQVGFFVGTCSLCQCAAFEEATRLMSTMAMAGHGRRVSLLSCCLRGEVEKLRSTKFSRAAKEEQRVEKSTRTQFSIRRLLLVPDGDQTSTQARVKSIDGQTRCHPQTLISPLAWHGADLSMKDTFSGVYR